MSAPQAIRTAVVGFGLAGSVFHAPLIAADEDFVLDTVVTANPEREQAAKGRYHDVRVARSPEEVWARADELDLVVLATPNRSHVPLTEAALRAGLPVVVDKPFTATAQEARDLAALAAQQGLMLSVYQNRRWDGDFVTLRRLVEEGELGPVWRLESRFDRWRPQLNGGWRESGEPSEVGGLLYDLGSHLVDQAVIVLGPVTTVYAELLVRRQGAQADDDTFIALEHANGARSHLWMNFISAAPAPRFRVLGRDGTFVKLGLDPQEAALKEGAVPGPGWGEEPENTWGTLTGADGKERTVRTLPGDYPAYYRGVAAALRSGGRPPVAVAEVVTDLEILEAAKRSAAEGRAVKLHP